MARIIKPGTLPVQQEHIFVCANCGCEFAPDRHEIRSIQHDGTSALCPTPGCGRYVYASWRPARRPKPCLPDWQGG